VRSFLVLTISEVVFRLRLRGVIASTDTLRRMIATGIIAAPAMVSGRRVWTDAALDELERSIRSYRDRRGQSAAATA
jgi:hypothetical protein